MNHLRCNGHPFLLVCLEQLSNICRGVHSALNMSVQLVPNAFDWVKIWWHGRPGKSLNDVVGEELYGVVCCIGSGVVMLKYSARGSWMWDDVWLQDFSNVLLCILGLLGHVPRVVFVWSWLHPTPLHPHHHVEVPHPHSSGQPLVGSAVDSPPPLLLSWLWKWKYSLSLNKVCFQSFLIVHWRQLCGPLDSVLAMTLGEEGSPVRSSTS